MPPRRPHTRELSSAAVILGGHAEKGEHLLVDRARVLFRSDIDANGTAVRVLMKGYGTIEYDEVHDKPFLMLPIQFEALEHVALGDGYST